jgi:hypothetical protein
MQHYLKSLMPFRGVQKPRRTEFGTRLFAEHPLSAVDSWVATMLELWRNAEYTCDPRANNTPDKAPIRH